MQSNAPENFVLTEQSAAASRAWHYSRCLNPPPKNSGEALGRLGRFRDFVETQSKTVWKFVSWARGHIGDLERKLSAQQQELAELEAAVGSTPPARPITRDSAVDARDQFETDSAELGRNVINNIQRLPVPLAQQICQQNKSRVTATLGCWESGGSGTTRRPPSDLARIFQLTVLLLRWRWEWGVPARQP